MCAHGGHQVRRCGRGGMRPAGSAMCGLGINLCPALLRQTAGAAAVRQHTSRAGRVDRRAVCKCAHTAGLPRATRSSPPTSPTRLERFSSPARPPTPTHPPPRASFSFSSPFVGPHQKKKDNNDERRTRCFWPTLNRLKPPPTPPPTATTPVAVPSLERRRHMVCRVQCACQACPGASRSQAASADSALQSTPYYM